ncbi:MULTISPECIES: hypothetical protein [Haloarculaceae]|uniref:hypothetical protein n=1 Tax=Halobacteriales TaxID=2235 RepID=UPI0012984962|nr:MULTISPECIES: hypothetical protein [Haloarculaceae]QGA82016.1 hypothetical protein LC1Hm_0954 [Halomicrobium sp. LC1Hm]
MLPLLLGPILGLVRTAIDLVLDFAAPLAVLASAVYIADRLGVIDVTALLTDLLPSPTDLIPLVGVVL